MNWLTLTSRYAVAFSIWRRSSGVRAIRMGLYPPVLGLRERERPVIFGTELFGIGQGESRMTKTNIVPTFRHRRKSLCEN